MPPTKAFLATSVAYWHGEAELAGYPISVVGINESLLYIVSSILTFIGQIS
jgi:hypothetical protein